LRKCDRFTEYREKEAMIPAKRERMNLSYCKKWMTEKIDELGQEVQFLKKQRNSTWIDQRCCDVIRTNE
jgi:hypothetical protein